MVTTAGLANQSGNSVASALFGLGLPRPFHAVRVVITPELALRLFSSRHEVLIDGAEQTTRPVASPLLALTVSYEL